MRIRISGAAWVAGDSSNNPVTTGTGRGPLPEREYLRPLSFSISGVGVVSAHIEAYSRVEILDAFGRPIAEMDIQGESLIWDRKDGRGAPARPGIYFIRLSGNGARETVRAVIF